MMHTACTSGNNRAHHSEAPCVSNRTRELAGDQWQWLPWQSSEQQSLGCVQ